MQIKIRDWGKHFERDRSRQWKHLEWVPIPNKQGSGYRKIFKEKNGLEIFAIWISLVEVASTCNPRGDLTKYNISDLSNLTLIDNQEKLKNGIDYLSQALDWIEVIENLDTNVKNLDTRGMSTSFDSPILFNPIQSCKEEGIGGKGKRGAHLFKNCIYFDFIKFRSELSEWSEEKCRHYYDNAVLYSEQKGKSYNGWIAAVKNWARMDEEKGKPFKEPQSLSPLNPGKYFEQLENGAAQ